MSAGLFRHNMFIDLLYILCILHNCSGEKKKKEKEKIAHSNLIEFRNSNMSGHRRHVHI